jgi:dTDP-4-dehydrorhamnose 3,5-epimerase
MSFHIVAQYMDGLVELRPDRYADHRGYFQETFRADQYADLGLPTDFVQHNHSRSVHGVVRGMHAQQGMGKLIRVVRGSIVLVELDIRPESPTFGQHQRFHVSDELGNIVWVPPGFANGFGVISTEADVVYLCTAVYNPTVEVGISPLDPQLGFEWGLDIITLSERDSQAPTWNAFKLTCCA